MPTDFTSTDNDPIVTDGDAQMFAPTPSWERGRKRGMFGSRGARVAPEPRSFAAEFSAEPEPAVVVTPTRPVRIKSEDLVDEPDVAFAATPVYASSTARRGNGAAPIAIAAGVILLGGLAAAGWYATQPHDTGVAELTPGATTTTTTATTAGDTTAAETTAPAQVAQNTAPPVVARSSTTTTSTRAAGPAVSHTTVAVARARPAAPSRSAADAGSNASVQAPVQAAPAPTPAPAAAAPAPAPLVLNIPAQPAPAASPPTETPVTPPTQTPPN